MNRLTILASLLGVTLMAAEADYRTQQESADKAFSELESEESSDKDLELQKKDLEIERLKLELEKRKLAEEKQKFQQSASGQQTFHQPRPAPKIKQEGFYVGLEAYRGMGTRTWKTTDADTSVTTETEENIEFSQQTLKIGMLVEGHRAYLGLTAGKDITEDGTSQYKEGHSIDAGFDFVFDTLYDASSSSNILPFLRAGIGIGFYEHLDEDKIYYEDDTATAVEVRLGVGIYYQIDRTFEVAASLERLASVQYFKDTNDNTLEITDALSSLSVGVNYHF